MMTNNSIEEIISGLRHCLAGEQYKDEPCKGCPYEDNMWPTLYCREHLYEDAIQALEDYECNAKEWLPTTISGMVQCPHCKAYWIGEITYNKFFRHCPRCGKRVKEITSEQERK